MEPEAHVGEAAELYALGELDERERAAVEAHIARCPACLRRVGEAEETLLALERGSRVRSEALDPRRTPSFARRRSANWWMLPALAAAVIVGMLLPRPSVRQDPATLAILHSHFSHAQFAGGGPAAKVLYARDRSWYYVIVAGRRRFDVYGIRHGQAVPMGTTLPKTETSELFARSPGSFERLELRDRGTFVESAAIR